MIKFIEGGFVMEQIEKQIKPVKEADLKGIDEEVLLEMEDIITPSPLGTVNCCHKG